MENKPLPILIILAAGASTRMGYPKGLYKHQGVGLLEGHLKLAADLGAPAIVVANQRNQMSYHQVLKDFPRATFVLNDNWEQGPFTSIQAGLRKMKQIQSAFVVPVDQLAPQKETMLALIDKIGDLMVAQPSHKGKKGHPVLLSKEFCEKLLSKKDSRLDQEIHALTDQQKVVVELADDRILSNINA